MFKRVPSARTKADKRYAADCSNVQPHYWQYSCYAPPWLRSNPAKHEVQQNMSSNKT